MDPDSIASTAAEEMPVIMPEKPSNFNPSNDLNLDDVLIVKDGWYWGSTIDGVPDGYGRLLFKPGINYHPEEIPGPLAGFRFQYVFYEGNFKFGVINGLGTLKTIGVDAAGAATRILVGMFENNKFSGAGKEIVKGIGDQSLQANGITLESAGSYYNGLAHGKVTINN